jgi:hypothetical protein
MTQFTPRETKTTDNGSIIFMSISPLTNGLFGSTILQEDIEE